MDPVGGGRPGSLPSGAHWGKGLALLTPVLSPFPLNLISSVSLILHQTLYNSSLLYTPQGSATVCDSSQVHEGGDSQRGNS